MKQLRRRIFAGPNGSGKSTVIKSLRETLVSGKNIDFGFYINADDIAAALIEKGHYSFFAFELVADQQDFFHTVQQSGLIDGDGVENLFQKSYSISENKIYLAAMDYAEQLAQIIADFLRKKLLTAYKWFSFETVFSHASKLGIIKQAVDAGYKVYLYFVSTEDVEINKFRVLSRVQKGGHNVPVDKIEKRHERSLSLMYAAAQLSYQAYFFDNSKDDTAPNHFAHFKMINGKKEWDKVVEQNVPAWFKKYYSAKIK